MSGKKKEFFGDPHIVERVTTYAQSGGDLKNTDKCLAFLLAQYREYTRKPQREFRQSVIKAMQVVSTFKEVAEVVSSEDEDDEEMEVDAQQQPIRPERSMNKGLLNLYKSVTAANKSNDSASIPSPGKVSSSSEVQQTKKRSRESTPVATALSQVTLDNSDDVIEVAGPSSSSNPEANAESPSEPQQQKQEQPQSANKRPLKRTKRKTVGEGSSAPGGEDVPQATMTQPAVAARPTVRYSDLGGIESALQDIRELIEYPMTHPEIYTHLGVDPPRGILLHGPPGCGKTLLAHAIAGELGVPFLKISAPEVVSGMSGESEAKLRALFKDAAAMAPAMIFIDEIDAITPKREVAQREMERRIVAQLLTCLDDLTPEKTRNNAAVVVVGATNRPDSLDPALRRAGRFDREISLGIPDEPARARILSVMCSKLRLSGDFNFASIARRTPGFVGADLGALAKESAIIAVNRIFHDLFSEAAASSSPASSAAIMEAIQESIVVEEAEMDGGESSSPVASEMDISSSSSSLPTPLAPSASALPVPANSHLTSGKMEVPNSMERAATKHREIAARSRISDQLKLQEGPLTPEQLLPLCITMADFEAALPKVQPSSKREGFATIPDVTFADVGALEDAREELALSILEPIKHPEKFAILGLNAPAGVLLYGPPGCGKTLLAKAIAHESGANFISVKGPELLNKYVGESEKSVRQVFTRARSSAPCVIFFDELDALCPRRGADSSSSGSSERVVNQLLTEMDGLEGRGQVFVIAATNRPDIIDPAMLRPGRLDKLLYVPMPSADARLSILQAHARKTPIEPGVNLAALAADPRCEGFSGADLAALVREASICSLREGLRNPSDMEAGRIVRKAHFDLALSRVLPSVSRSDSKLYGEMQGRLRRSRAHIQPDQQPQQPASGASSSSAPSATPSSSTPIA